MLVPAEWAWLVGYLAAAVLEQIVVGTVGVGKLGIGLPGHTMGPAVGIRLGQALARIAAVGIVAGEATAGPSAVALAEASVVVEAWPVNAPTAGKALLLAHIALPAAAAEY